MNCPGDAHDIQYIILSERIKLDRFDIVVKQARADESLNKGFFCHRKCGGTGNTDKQISFRDLRLKHTSSVFFTAIAAFMENPFTWVL